MKQYAVLFLLCFTSILYSQKKNVKAHLTSIDTTSLNIITVLPDSFPQISVIFEALKNGKPTFELRKDKIRVYEDDIKCVPVSLTPITDNYPINISLVIDHSGSMAVDYSQIVDTVNQKYVDGVEFGVDSLGRIIIAKYPEGYFSPIDNAKKALVTFIEHFSSAKDSFQIIGFATKVDVVSSFSSDKQYLNNIVNGIEASSSTAFLDALEYAVNELKFRKGINVIVALTDGLDNSSHILSDTLIKLSNNFNIPIYSVGLGEVDKEFLKNISTKTNGDFFYASTSNDLVDLYQDIQNRIISIYDLKYKSVNLATNDTIRKLRIEFDIDSMYLNHNISELKIPKETLIYINNKAKKEKYKIIGFSVSGALVGAGFLLFVFRKKKRKKSVKE